MTPLEVLEPAPIVGGLQLSYSIACERTSTSATSIRVLATLTNVGRDLRHLQIDRVEVRDRDDAGFLEVCSRFATEPAEELCGLGQEFADWRHTPLQVTLKPGETYTEEWVVGTQGLRAANIDGSWRDGVICLESATTYRFRLTALPQDLDDPRRTANGLSTYFPFVSIPGPVYQLTLSRLPSAPN